MRRTTKLTYKTTTEATQLWTRLQVCHATLQQLDAMDQDVRGLERLAAQCHVSDQLPELRDTRNQIDYLRASVVNIVQLLLLQPSPTVH